MSDAVFDATSGVLEQVILECERLLGEDVHSIDECVPIVFATDGQVQNDIELLNSLAIHEQRLRGNGTDSRQVFILGTSLGMLGIDALIASVHVEEVVIYKQDLLRDFRDLPLGHYEKPDYRSRNAQWKINLQRAVAKGKRNAVRRGK